MHSFCISDIDENYKSIWNPHCRTLISYPLHCIANITPFSNPIGYQYPDVLCVLPVRCRQSCRSPPVGGRKVWTKLNLNALIDN